MSRSFVEPDTPRACRTAFRLVGIGLRRLARVHSQRDETHDRPRAAHTYKRTHTRARGWKFYACRVARATSERENYSYDLSLIINPPTRDEHVVNSSLKSASLSPPHPGRYQGIHGHGGLTIGSVGSEGWEGSMGTGLENNSSGIAKDDEGRRG